MRREIIDIPRICTGLIFAVVLVSTRGTNISCKNSTSWTLVTRPKLFCEYMQLHCFLDDNIPLNRIRQWSLGPNDKLLVYNGTSLNSTKYVEELDQTRRISILTVRLLDSKDVNVQYTCQLGFQKCKNWLNITTEDFQCKYSIVNEYSTVNEFHFIIASFVISVVFVTATFVGIVSSMLPIC